MGPRRSAAVRCPGAAVLPWNPERARVTPAGRRTSAALRPVRPMYNRPRSRARFSRNAKSSRNGAVPHVERRDIFTPAFNFIDKHDLEKRHTYFDPDYEMAESWQRLTSSGAALEHDKILVRHEVYEAELMRSGLGYNSAHAMAEKAGHNYARTLKEWKGATGDA
jgi:hypothetical protein